MLRKVSKIEYGLMPAHRGGYIYHRDLPALPSIIQDTWGEVNFYIRSIDSP